MNGTSEPCDAPRTARPMTQPFSSSEKDSHVVSGVWVNCHNSKVWIKAIHGSLLWSFNPGNHQYPWGKPQSKVGFMHFLWFPYPDCSHQIHPDLWVPNLCEFLCPTVPHPPFQMPTVDQMNSMNIDPEKIMVQWPNCPTHDRCDLPLKGWRTPQDSTLHRSFTPILGKVVASAEAYGTRTEAVPSATINHQPCCSTLGKTPGPLQLVGCCWHDLSNSAELVLSDSDLWLRYMKIYERGLWIGRFNHMIGRFNVFGAIHLGLGSVGHAMRSIDLCWLTPLHVWLKSP